MKYVIIIKDGADTYEVRYMETPSLVLKTIGGVFEHDLPKFIRDRFNEIKGISFRVCQKHYDKRIHRGIVSIDEIVPDNECSLCKKNTL
jgi:hypothetical protein